MFTTVTDVETAAIASIEEEDHQTSPVPQERSARGVWEFTDSGLLQDKRDTIIATMSRDRGKPLIRKSKALYWSSDHELRVACSISKRYLRDSSRYWYAYHPQWDDFLSEAKQSYFVLGCMDLDVAFAIDRDQLRSRVGSLNTTTKDDGVSYWHIHIVDKGDGKYAIALPKTGDALSLEPFKLTLPRE